MAAPSGIKWGSAVGSGNKQFRIGIYVNVTNVSNTVAKRETQIWVWTKYGVDDSNNTFYYNDNASSATTSKGSVDVKTTVSSGDGWSTSNQKKLATYTYEFTRGTSAVTRSVAAALKGLDYIGSSYKATCTTTYTIPALPSYKVSYNANGGSGAPSAQTKYYGKALTLSSTKPTRSGYTFVGWGTTASDTSSNYSAGGSYTANSAITLYAIWKKTITLSYNANSGSGAPSAQSATVYNATTSHKFTLSSTIPKRTGYTFLGWSTSSTATSATYSAGGTITLSASDTLYAVWKINSYTVKVDPNGGYRVSDGKTDVHSFTKNYGATEPINERRRTGYTLTGYTIKNTASGSTTDIGGATITFDSSTKTATFTQGTVAVTLVAKWKINSYELTVDPNGGTWNGSTENQMFTENYNTVKTIPVPTRSGYTFTGWTLSGGGKISSTDAVTVNYTYGTSAGTLTANWTINSYTLTVKPGGGTWNGSGADQNITQNYNTTKSIPVPIWEGHTFSGWLLTGGGKISPTGAVATTYTFGTKDATLTARWDTNDYVVTFDAGLNGGHMPDGTEKSNTIIEYNTAIGTLPTPTRKNYTFLGWFTEPTGGTRVDNNYVVTGDVILYAQYEIDASAWVNDSDVWEEGVVYTNVDGSMKKGHAKVNDNGVWKDGLCK